MPKKTSEDTETRINEIETRVGATYAKEEELVNQIIQIHAERNKFLDESTSLVRSVRGLKAKMKAMYFPNRFELMYRMFRAGMTNTEIAGYLNISVNKIREMKESRSISDLEPEIACSLEPEKHPPIKSLQREPRGIQASQPVQSSCPVYLVPEHPMTDSLREVINYIDSKMKTNEDWNFLDAYVNFKFSSRSI